MRVPRGRRERRGRRGARGGRRVRLRPTPRRTSAAWSNVIVPPLLRKRHRATAAPAAAAPAASEPADAEPSAGKARPAFVLPGEPTGELPEEMAKKFRGLLEKTREARAGHAPHARQQPPLEPRASPCPAQESVAERVARANEQVAQTSAYSNRRAAPKAPAAARGSGTHSGPCPRPRHPGPGIQLAALGRSAGVRSVCAGRDYRHLERDRPREQQARPRQGPAFGM